MSTDIRTRTADAPAKINLYLDVLSRRPDGYHNLDSLMQSVSLCDTVTVTVTPGADRITLTCSEPALPTDNGNLAYRAASCFVEEFDIKGQDIGIHIEKRIPVCAGLGGGSTDAAAVLSLLSDLFPVDRSRLFPLAGKLGADVPFCLLGGTARAQGIGERLTPLPPMPDCFLLIACDGEGISTPAAFTALDNTLSLTDQNTPHGGDIIAALSALQNSPAALAAALYNAFHSMILSQHAVARTIAAVMKEYGALAAQLSGSGPSVFGIFEDLTLAGCASAALTARGIDSFVARPLPRTEFQSESNHLS